MITIGSTPPPSPAKTPADSAETVTEPSAVEAARKREHKADDEDAAKDKAAPQEESGDGSELTDEMLLKVMRAFSGEQGTVVDKKV